ncbi:hypothetical protein [Microbacterium paludicola]|uniref:hypothetical protein n=1 Tax=Microbacterium paludicola TaxID=300019 RepID=UPI0031D27A75
MAISRERLYELQARHRHANWLRLIDYLESHPCVDCGETDPIVLDFDHLPGVDKKFTISRAVGASTRSWRAIALEIAKCEVVCANCHRRRTAMRAKFRKHLLGDGLAVPAPAVEVSGFRVPHGGGSRGRRGCSCDPCRLRRREYSRERRAAKRQQDGAP